MKGSKVQGSSPPWPPARSVAYASEPTPRKVRCDVAVKLVSHSMGLAFHHHNLTCQVWARGFILAPVLHLGCVFTKKAVASSGLLQNLGPNWQLLEKMRIINQDFRSLMPSLSLTLNLEPISFSEKR